MQGGEKARREEGKSSVRACFPNLAAQRAGAAPSGGSPGRFASARDSSEPGSLSGLGLPRSLPATCSPPLSLPASQPAGARAPAPPPPCCRAPPPPPASRKRVAPPRATRWGRPCWGREDPCSPAAVYLTAAADASDPLWAHPAPRNPRLGVVEDQETHEIASLCEPPRGLQKQILFGFLCLCSSPLN